MTGPNAKIAFLHLHKTGGTSFDAFLRRILPTHRFAPRDGAGKIAPAALDAGYDAYSGHYRAAEMASLPNDLIKITILREPTERLLSHYYFHKSYRVENIARFGRPLLLKTKTSSLGLLLEDAEYVDFYSRFYVKALDPDYRGHGKPSLERALDFLSGFDAIGVTSRLQTLMAQVAARLGASLPGDAPMLNSRKALEGLDGFEQAAIEPLTAAQLARIEDIVGEDRILYDFALTRAM